MEENKRLAERILHRFEQHRQELAEKQLQLDEDMKELLEHKDRLAVGAKRRIESVILPLMQELLQHFDNGKVDVLLSDDYFGCVCKFVHTPRFPATVSFSIDILPGSETSYTARSDLNILPVLMEYNRNNEALFPLDDDSEALSIWAEDRILEFVDIYLRLETHPLYQKDNTVIDIVCGMHIPFTAATSSVVRDDRTFYFCSEHCKEAFIKGSN